MPLAGTRIGAVYMVLDSTHADERWSPASRDLVSELPAMVRWMHDDGFDVRRVMYNPADWDPAVSRASNVGGRKVKLGAYHYQARRTVTVVSDDGQQRVVLRLPALAS